MSSIFRDYGYRRLRSKSQTEVPHQRLGYREFRQVLEDEYLGRKLIDGPAPEPLKGPAITSVCRNSERPQCRRLRRHRGPGIGHQTHRRRRRRRARGFGPHPVHAYQKLIVLDVPDDKVDSLIEELAGYGLSAVRPIGAGISWRAAGSSSANCRSWDPKRSQDLVPELEERLADINDKLDVPITVNINGCPNSCARSQIADIGFKGQLVEDDNGSQTEGFQVHLGGSLGLDSGFGRKLRQHKVTSAEMGDYIDRVVRNFVEQREEGERFAQWAVRADEEALR